MEDLLVLGVIPSTTIQIDFMDWVVLMQIILLLVLTAVWVNRKLTNWHAYFTSTHRIRSIIEFYTR